MPFIFLSTSARISASSAASSAGVSFRAHARVEDGGCCWENRDCLCTFKWRVVYGRLSKRVCVHVVHSPKRESHASSITFSCIGTYLRQRALSPCVHGRHEG